MATKKLTKIQTVLKKLNSKYGVTRKELLQIVANPTSAIWSLRSKGYNIELYVKNKKGETAYRLVNK